MEFDSNQCCKKCVYWKRTYDTAGICIALVGRDDVPIWAPFAANSCTNEIDGKTCPVFVNSENS